MDSAGQCIDAVTYEGPVYEDYLMLAQMLNFTLELKEKESSSMNQHAHPLFRRVKVAA